MNDLKIYNRVLPPDQYTSWQEVKENNKETSQQLQDYNQFSNF